MLGDILPDDVTSYTASFEDCGCVPLNKRNPYSLTGFTPSKSSPSFILILSLPIRCLNILCFCFVVVVDDDDDDVVVGIKKLLLAVRSKIF